MIYHLVTEAEFLDCFNGDIYIPPSLAECGFIHCALESSVVPVANDFFATVTGHLLVLEIDPDKLDTQVKYESAAPAASGGVSHLESASVFPHVYGPVNSGTIVGVALMEKSASGYNWPVEFSPRDVSRENSPQ
jgi:uncharacterized protein (DUF952 family)